MSKGTNEAMENLNTSMDLLLFAADLLSRDDHAGAVECYNRAMEFLDAGIECEHEEAAWTVNQILGLAYEFEMDAEIYA